MKRFIVVAIATVLVLVSTGSAAQRPATPAAGSSIGSAAVRTSSPAAASTPAARKALLDQYCVTCHNVDDKVAGITFDTMDLSRVAKDGEVWEKAIKKL